MIKYKNECCSCATDAYPCLGRSCKNMNVPHFFCDKCGEEHDPEDLYDDDGKMKCGNCVLGQYKTVAEVGIDEYTN